MVISDDIYAMLLTHAKMKEFTRKPVADATKSTELLIALALDSKQEVDTMFDAAVKNGGSEARGTMDYGFMYNRSFNDLDGHIWEILWMDMSQMQG